MWCILTQFFEFTKLIENQIFIPSKFTISFQGIKLFSLHTFPFSSKVSGLMYILSLSFDLIRMGKVQISHAECR